MPPRSPRRSSKGSGSSCCARTARSWNCPGGSGWPDVGIPLRLRALPADVRKARVALLLEIVGLGSHARQRPGEMSGGQQQRVAIARALANSPRLLIADAPTGLVDTETGLSIMVLLRAVVQAEGMTAIVSTHDPLMLQLADRVNRLADGRLVDA
ncbi:ATP-binding cassette domain-containing protein [Cellulomonas sp.]|uniref:ATP-binding cassette domain-containing protein n=1 Tax=Cellulomonas sp. TaxID=40001 RepID=UPI0025BF1460|nr:ATP-binding cassette domain-containing protein [Cellulomonas sp.]